MRRLRRWISIGRRLRTLSAERTVIPSVARDPSFAGRAGSVGMTGTSSRSEGPRPCGRNPLRRILYSVQPSYRTVSWVRNPPYIPQSHETRSPASRSSSRAARTISSRNISRRPIRQSSTGRRVRSRGACSRRIRLRQSHRYLDPVLRTALADRRSARLQKILERLGRVRHILRE